MAKTTNHKEGKAHVKIVYWVSKTLADGSHPFVVRIHKDKTRKHITTSESLQPKYWNPKAGNYREGIRRSYSEPFRSNLIDNLEKWEKKYLNIANTLAEADEPHDANAVVRKVVEERTQTRKVLLLAYIDELVVKMVAARQKGNSIIYKDLRNQLADFLNDEHSGATDIAFSEVSVRFCNHLETYFRQRDNSDTTLSNRFRTLRAVFNKAIAESGAKAEHYPFARNVAEKHKYSIGKFDTTTQKRALSRDEIRRIEAFIPIGTHTGPHSSLRNSVETERLSVAKNAFLFSFYCGGINFVDLAKLRWSSLTTDQEGGMRLHYVRQKTGGKFSLKLLPPAIAIIEQYRPTTQGGPQSYVFPFLNKDKHQTPSQIHNRTHKVSAMVNEDLKTIGERARIDTPVTFYVARHSFATALRHAGTSTAVISQAMGHKTEAVTAVYLKSFSSEIVDEAYDALL